jgi:hypothetical protein
MQCILNKLAELPFNGGLAFYLEKADDMKNLFILILPLFCINASLYTRI